MPPDVLAAARAAATPAARLTALVEAWRATKLAELVPLIDKLGKQIADKRPRLAGKTIDDKTASWLALAKAKDSTDVQLLLTDPSIEHVLHREFDKKYPTLAAWPPDPRIARALVARIREDYDLSEDPHRASYEPIWLAIGRIGDPATLKPLAAIAKRYRIDTRDTRAALAALAKVMPATATPAIKKTIRALSAIGKGTRKTLAALLADVYAHPADDGPRLVYADALQEADDPRGEYIVLACKHDRGELDSAGRGRMTKLLSANREKWLEPLAPVLSYGTQAFRRGFLSRATTTGVEMSNEAAIRKIYKHPAWALLDEVTFSRGGLEYRAPLVAHLRALGVKITVK
jgi:uncharacterized protein (TIGR02996 family)